MNPKHIQSVALREYLLRTLSDNDAAAIEERYFTDSVFFKQMREAEMELIRDYLDGRLNDSDRARFEERYMHVQVLRKLVDEVDKQRTAVRRARRRSLTVVLVTAAVCLVVASIAMVRHFLAGSGTKSPQIATVHLPSHSLMVLVLTPGVSKGTGQETPVLTLPDTPQPIFLAAMLPDQASSAVYSVRLLNVDLKGEHKNVWSATGIPSALQMESSRSEWNFPPRLSQWATTSWNWKRREGTRGKVMYSG